MADDWFLRLFDPDPVKAARMYATLRQKLVFFFQQHGCTDPEELADEAISRALAAVQRGATITTTIGGFCYGIAKNVLQEYYRRRQEVELTDEIENQRRTGIGALTANESAILLRECLELLPPEDGKLLKRYYLEDRHSLARELGKSENALRVEIFRIKKELRQRVKQGRVEVNDQPSGHE